MTPAAADDKMIPSRRPALDLGRGQRAAFTLVELLVVIGIIAILMGILIPVLGIARESGRCAKCLANLHQIGMAINMYANDHNNYLVPGDSFGLADPPPGPGTFMSSGSWVIQLVELGYISGPQTAAGGGASTNITGGTADFAENTILFCPDGQDLDISNLGFPTSQTDIRGAGWSSRKDDFDNPPVVVPVWYAINCAPYQILKGGQPLPFTFLPDKNPTTGALIWKVNRLTDFNNTTQLPLVFDGAWMLDFVAGTTNYDPSRINARHYNGRSTNILFAEGHCETQPTNTLPNANWYLQ